MTEQEQNDRLTRIEMSIKALSKSFDVHKQEMRDHIKETDLYREALSDIEGEFKSLKFGTKIIIRLAASIPFVLAAMYYAVRWMVGVEHGPH